MTKRGLMGLLLTLATVVAMAVPAKPGQWRKIQLSDGTEVRALLVGDEHGHCWRGEDGRMFLPVEGTDYYTVIDGEQQVKRARLKREQNNLRRQKRLRRRAGDTGQDGFFGQKKGLIILVNFKDTQLKSAHTQNYFSRMANEEGFSDGDFVGSMADYFEAQSGGQFELDFDVVGPVAVSRNASYYGANDADGNDKYPGAMVIEAVRLVKQQVSNWSQYDWDGDGYVDQVYVIYAGKGEADGGSNSTIWPHECSLAEEAYYGDGSGPETVATGLKVDTYACGPELDGMGAINGIGTMCHEFSHCLGYPDAYDIDYSGGQGMGYWDLMDGGSYNGNGYIPCGYTSFERWMAGWIEPVVLEDDDADITGMKALTEGGESYIIYNKGHRDEFFLLENRQQSGWDAALPGAGLLILHIDYDDQVWLSNTPNDDPSHQRMTWMPADNSYQYETYEGYKYFTEEGMANDPYPYRTNNVFNKSSKPAAKFYNKNIDKTYYLDGSVEQIARGANGTISFHFAAAGSGSGDNPTPTPGPGLDGALFYESFNDCTGKGGNDDVWSGNVAIAAFVTDVDGWESDKAYGGDGCAKFGTSKVDGSATTPAFEVDGDVVLYFKAGAWDTKSDSRTLELSVEGGTITPSQVEMERGAWGDFEAVISASGDVRVTFSSAKGRFFLDEVIAKVAIPTGIAEVAPRSAEHRIFTLDGRYVGSNMKALRPGLYIVNGKKVIK